MDDMAIDYDAQIALTKEALAKDLKHTKETYAKVIAELEDAKKKQAEHIAYKQRLKYATSASGLKYRVATDKMREFAESIENAYLTDGAQDFDAECPKVVESLEAYAKKLDYVDLDSFDLVKAYISSHVDLAKRIWEANKQEYKRQREEAYKHSWQYELDQKRKKYEEECERREAEARAYDLAHRIYDADGGYWCTGFGSNGMYVDKFGET